MIHVYIHELEPGRWAAAVLDANDTVLDVGIEETKDEIVHWAQLARAAYLHDPGPHHIPDMYDRAH